MSVEIDRAKPMFQLRTRAILMSGANAFRLSDRLAPTAIGYVGSGLNDCGFRRSVCESRTGHDSPGPTRPVLALRDSEIVPPRLPPKTPMSVVSAWRS